MRVFRVEILALKISSVFSARGGDRRLSDLLDQIDPGLILFLFQRDSDTVRFDLDSTFCRVDVIGQWFLKEAEVFVLEPADFKIN